MRSRPSFLEGALLGFLCGWLFKGAHAGVEMKSWIDITVMLGTTVLAVIVQELRLRVERAERQHRAARSWRPPWERP